MVHLKLAVPTRHELRKCAVLLQRRDAFLYAQLGLLAKVGRKPENSRDFRSRSRARLGTDCHIKASIQEANAGFRNLLSANRSDTDNNSFDGALLARL